MPDWPVVPGQETATSVGVEDSMRQMPELPRNSALSAKAERARPLASWKTGGCGRVVENARGATARTSRSATAKRLVMVASERSTHCGDGAIILGV
jgi:hypothetical protein